jgi:spore coat polysaccharide biosynthesis predicted glycosyltransferase SpsG
VKVTLLTEGGRDIGYGHITRCASIYEAFEEIGKQSQLIVNGDETIENLLKGKKYKVLNWLDDQQLLFEILDDANIVFIDSYLAEHDIYERISEQIKTAVYFDDDLRIDYPRGFVLNGAIFAEQLPYPKKRDVTNLLGTTYTPIRREFWDTPPKLIRKEVETLMVIFGGSDMCNVTPKIQKVLNKTYPYVQKEIIVTRLFANISEIKKLRDKNTELICEPDAIELKEIMQESDIAISAGGQTLYELARVGVPTIGICIAQNQLQNLNGWSKSGFLEYIGWYNNKDIQSKLIAALKKMKFYNKRISCSKRTRELIDGKGSRRVCDILLQGTQ